ncbi:hypothetical protein HZA26_02185 [Candidatus Nomurabacteria bacterium]|nr:hypothetical protein [Candidatus Nomurabacteria bacterium]
MDTQNNSSTNVPSVESKAGHNTLMGVLCYLGPLVIVSYFMGKDEPFVKFHVKQGLVLFGIEILIGVVTPMFFWQMSSLMKLLNLATTILSIIGIVNVVQKKEKMLPIIGGLSSHLTF